MAEMEERTNSMQFVRMFESKLASFTGFNQAVCVDCCTNGILVALELCARNGTVNKGSTRLEMPARTYMSVPMTLINNGWWVSLEDIDWYGQYRLGPTPVYDAATDFDADMADRYPVDSFVCVSFQQKKRLSLGRGGAILLNSADHAAVLRRMVYDGRDPFIPDRIEVEKFPDDIIRGYHCYMDPEKAALGIARLNQLSVPYSPRGAGDYPDLRRLKIWTA